MWRMQPLCTWRDLELGNTIDDDAARVVLLTTAEAGRPNVFSSGIFSVVCRNAFFE